MSQNNGKKPFPASYFQNALERIDSAGSFFLCILCNQEKPLHKTKSSVHVILIRKKAEMTSDLKRKWTKQTHTCKTMKSRYKCTNMKNGSKPNNQLPPIISKNHSPTQSFRVQSTKNDATDQPTCINSMVEDNLYKTHTYSIFPVIPRRKIF